MGYLVTISDRRMIPGIGRGPIKKPITITEKKLQLLKVLGFTVTVIKPVNANLKKIDKKQTENIDDNHTSELVEEIINEVSEETTTEEVIKNPQEEIVEKENDEEVIDNDSSEELDEETEENNNTIEDEVADEEFPVEEEEEIDIDNLTKSQLKEILDEKGVSYPSNANLTKLRNILTEYMNSSEDKEE